jgi:uncharacterized membrane protein YedE/YeeE
MNVSALLSVATLALLSAVSAGRRPHIVQNNVAGPGGSIVGNGFVLGGGRGYGW